jgi:hypothetical protein
MRTTARVSGYRRTKLGLMASIGVMAATFVATTGTGGASPAAPADGPVQPGQGTAVSQTMRIDPRAGNLSIGIIFGISLGAHQNTAAQATSQAIDLGTIGTSLASQGCDGSAPSVPDDKQPHAIVADTRNPDSPQTVGPEDEPTAPGFKKFVEVKADPYAHSITDVAPFGVPATVSFGGGESESHSGIVNGVREAVSSASTGPITLPGGITIASMHWTARVASDGDPVGTFTMGDVKIGPATVIPAGTDPKAAFDAMNAVLSPLGENLTPPRVHTENGVLFVDPVGLSVVPNTTRDQVASAAIKGVQPIREPLVDALLKAKCTLSAELTVADIAIGSVTGAGSYNMSFGGVQAVSSEVTANGFKLGFGGALGAGGGSGPSTLGTGGNTTSLGTSHGTPAVGGATSGTTAKPSGAAAGAAPASPSTKPAAATSPIKGARGGAMAGVGLGCLALLGLVAEADRRKMRRAQREFPITA